jgi:hypothetical protein
VVKRGALEAPAPQAPHRPDEAVHEGGRGGWRDGGHCDQAAGPAGLESCGAHRGRRGERCTSGECKACSAVAGDPKGARGPGQAPGGSGSGSSAASAVPTGAARPDAKRCTGGASYSGAAAEDSGADSRGAGVRSVCGASSFDSCGRSVCGASSFDSCGRSVRGASGCGGCAGGQDAGRGPWLDQGGF